MANTAPALTPQMPPHADILLVTVTDVEAQAIFDVLQAQFGRSLVRHHIEGKTYYDLGSIGGATVAMVQSEMGAGGLGAAFLTVQKGIDALHPSAVIMVGIAFGVDSKKQRIGDVLVSRQLMLYEPQRVGQSKAGSPEIRARGDRSPASPALLDTFRSGKLDWSPPVTSHAARGSTPPEVRFGLIVTGEKLVDNLEFREQLRHLEPDAIGGEMEGAGLYVAAHDRGVAWILVKAICDWADGNKGRGKQQRQKLAAQNAAHFVFHVLQLGGIAQLGKRNADEAALQNNVSNTNVVPHPPSVRVSGNAPPLPKLMVGREDDVRQVKQWLGIGAPNVSAVHVLTAMRGWPGVGKTTLVSALAYDPDVAAMFPDGVLWASIGQQPSLFAELAAWGRALGIPDLAQARTTEEASAQLRAVLRSKRMLLIVDDVWDARHAEPFRVGGSDCALLITTRLQDVARVVAPTADDVYILGVLSSEKALELLQQLAPEVVQQHPDVCQELVNDLEGLPLAIQVAGRLLQAEYSYGFSVVTLLSDIREGAKIIESKAPVDRAEVANDTTPTIAALLNKSTDLLDDDTREYFAYLGAFAPKPATFDADAMQAVWMVDDPKPAIRKLVDHGLLELIENSRFWMHAVLVAHAKSFLTDE
jgi:nucleoside phosphorylase